MEYWNIGPVMHGIENDRDSWDKLIMDRKNSNQAFKKLKVRQDANALFVLAYKIFTNFPLFQHSIIPCGMLNQYCAPTQPIVQA